jgi:hypothetical protein
MSFYRELLRFELGLVPGHVLPSLAVRALEDGLDSPALRILASFSLCEYDPEGVQAAYRQARNDFRVSIPSRTEAAFLLLEALLADIVNNSLDPYLGAKQIVGDIYYQGDWSARNVRYVGDSLGIEALFGIADSIDDLLESTHQWQPPRSNADLITQATAELREEAARLLATRPWRQSPAGAA